VEASWNIKIPVMKIEKDIFFS
jgi:hypothetical protein